MSSSSISKSCPAAVSAALASAMDIDGASLPVRAHVVSFCARWVRGAVEDGAAVVGQLRHGLADVLQGPVAALLDRGGLVDVGEPAPAELLDGGDVDGAVVEEVLDLGQLRGQEAPVGPDGVPGQGNRAGLGDVRLQEGQGLRPGVGQAQGRRLDVGQEARAGVHGAHEVVHVGQLLRRGVHHQVGTLLHDGQVVVGDEAGDLDDGVARRIEPRHLEIDPGQHARACYRSVRREGGWRRPCNVRRCCASPCSSSTPSCRCPRYARTGDAGADLIARTDAVLACRGGRAVVPTGVAVAIPDGLRRPGPAAERAGRSATASPASTRPG